MRKGLTWFTNMNHNLMSVNDGGGGIWKLEMLLMRSWLGQ